MTDILALIQAQLKAPKDQENKFGGYKYRNAESILRAFKEVQPPDVSLTMSDSITFIGERLFLVATVKLHHNGTVIAEAQGAAMHALTKKGMDDAQITGACSSYARKYALCGLFAIDDSTDDPDSKDNRQDATKPSPRQADKPKLDAEEAHERAVVDAQVMIESATSKDDLRGVWSNLAKTTQADARVIEAKDKRKTELEG